jgi:NADPH2:quinone reductase
LKVVEIKKYGGPEVLEIGSREIPVLKENEVLIKVKAAGINRPDILQREGNYPPPKDSSDILGLEIAGEVVKVGKKVKNIKIIDKVCALVSGGGYAEYCSAPFTQCLPIPKGLTFEEACILPETFFTIWFNLFIKNKVKKKQKILIHGGSGGIGTTAIQITKNFGLEVFTTTRSQNKSIKCKKLGAHYSINTKKTDFEEFIKKKTNGDGVDVILDIVGGNYVQKNINILKRNGLLINLGWLTGSVVKINLLMVMLKRLTITGSTLRVGPLKEKERIAKELKKNIWPLIEQKKIKPLLCKTFYINKVKDAHIYIDKEIHFGKIALKF